MKLVIGIDDTDNLESRGTGYRARQLALSLGEEGLAVPHHITRHQLLVDPRIPYTSHNSSASIVVETLAEEQKISDFCAGFIARESAPGSDAGLCIARYGEIPAEVTGWGESAKVRVLPIEAAWKLAERHGIFLAGLTGEKTGVIGSLAAVGLCRQGNDGRVLWMKGLRELKGVFRASEILDMLEVDAIAGRDLRPVPPDHRVCIGDWCRPVNIKNQITLIVEEASYHECYEWQTVSKDFIKSISR